MATAMNNDKIIGAVGLAAVIFFAITLLVAIFQAGDFGSTTVVGLLENEDSKMIFQVGCIVAGILGAVFGLLITFWKPESKVFIGKIRGILIVLAGVALVVFGAMEGEQWTVYLFIALIALAAISDVFYNWIVDQKMIMVFSLILMLMIVLTGALSQVNDDNVIYGYAFILFVIIWVLLVALMKLAPVVEEPEKKGKKAKAKEPEPKKKNAPAPRPYPAKKEEPKKAAPPVKKEEPKKQEPPKKEEPKKQEPAKTESKEELPKLKVMSSREAAAARDARKKEEPAQVVEEPTLVAEPVYEPPVEEAEVIEEAEVVYEPEVEADVPTESEEPFEMDEDTPSGLLRRATWNKGLRCRLEYGELQIPIAYVKAKVAVYLFDSESIVIPKEKEKLESDGWTVMVFYEKDITDGKEQAEEINKVVKDKLKAERAAKKKKTKK